ncbi:CLUMA_CG003518, isoform A [Clunio marinus]|uniref:CLUMA_CG003518, isoform A n=1 Tax=Clunio marinus TaxID=568069 RepID=A0A1J1HP40_9DIPT|nr:CLUMA_CG003518, isoform A [Clunio marinus]
MVANQQTFANLFKNQLWSLTQLCVDVLISISKNLLRRQTAVATATHYSSDVNKISPTEASSSCHKSFITYTNATGSKNI